MKNMKQKLLTGIVLATGVLGSVNEGKAVSPASQFFTCENDYISIEIYENEAVVMLDGESSSRVLEKLGDSPARSETIYMDAEEIGRLSLRKGLLPQAKYTISQGVQITPDQYKEITVLEVTARCKKVR